jgi:hypothetical protein
MASSIGKFRKQWGDDKYMILVGKSEYKKTHLKSWHKLEDRIQMGL